MDAELKAKWVTALRSGEYRQGRYNLRTASDTYCCLGVLCDVINPDGWDSLDGGAGHLWSESDNSDANGSVLPADVASRLFGNTDPYRPWITNNNGALDFEDRDGDVECLSALNDTGEFTFDQIADIIENRF